MNRTEYIISLTTWNYYISSISEYEVIKLERAFGTLGKALTEYQSIYSILAKRACTHPYIPQFDDYKKVVEELRLRTEVKLIAREEN